MGRGGSTGKSMLGVGEVGTFKRGTRLPGGDIGGIIFGEINVRELGVGAKRGCRGGLSGSGGCSGGCG